MATNYPTSLDSFTNPSPGETVASAPIGNAFDAIEALEEYAGVTDGVPATLTARIAALEAGGGGGGGSTKVYLGPGSAVFPDGSASNLAPQLSRVKSSAAAPTPYFYQLLFSGTQLEQCVWDFVVPDNYDSAPVLLIQYKMAAATTGNVVLDARLAAVTPGESTDVDAKGFGAANGLTDAVPGTAGYLKEASLTLTNADSLAAGDFAILYLARDGANGSDTAPGDMEVVSVTLSYTAA